jgi:hypothetical protein
MVVYGRMSRLTHNPTPRQYPSLPPTVKTLAEEVALLESTKFCIGCKRMVPHTGYLKRGTGLSKRCRECNYKQRGLCAA